MPEVNLDGLHASYVAPQSKTEKIIVNAFEKAFNLEKISVYDDFNRLGGDSLTAIKLISYIKGYNISAADILSLHTPKAIADTISENNFDLDLYSLENGCPLNEPQLNVYLDILANDKINSYMIPAVIDISKRYSVEEIYGALNTMLEVHPILSMRVSEEYGVPYLVKASEIPINFEEDAEDNYIKEFLTEAFDLTDSLSRFLIVDDNDKYSLFCVFHHIIYDALSNQVFKQDLFTILNGGSVDIDDSFLKVSAFTQQIQNAPEFDEAYKFYELMLEGSDELTGLIECVSSQGPGVFEADLELNLNEFKSFLKKYGVSENTLFTGVFAYTLSRFTGSDKVLVNIIENGQDRFNNYDTIGMYVNTLPMIVNCKNQNIESFMENLSDKIYKVRKYNYYPFRLLANEFDISADILFQYLPDWVSDNEKNDSYHSKFKFDEINKNVISDLSADLIQKENEYCLKITYSDKYSEKMVERFANTYKSILSQIFNANKLSDINYISKEDIELLDSYNQTEYPLKYNDI